MFHRIGAAAYKPDIGNISLLCESLQNPHRKFKSVHVAGTNGKGSTSSLIASSFQEAGYKVGLFTSPHLTDFRERIRVNGKKISEHFVADFVTTQHEKWNSIQPSFFEITTALAFHYFAEQQVDMAIIEVGMGGRLDSTNIIQPEICVITSIGNDHAQFLGDTPEKIAFEKAGIIKQAVPVVTGHIAEGPLQVIRNRAAELHAPFFESTDAPAPKSALEGNYQAYNEKTAYVALYELDKLGWNLPDETIEIGFQNVVKNTHLRGRWQVLSNAPMIVAEVAHNEEGIAQLQQKLAETSHQHLHIVIGMVEDKNHDAVLKYFPKEATYYFCAAQIPRALPAEALQQKASHFDLNGNCYPTVQLALDAAKNRAQESDLVLITGSIFTVAEILPEED